MNYIYTYIQHFFPTPLSWVGPVGKILVEAFILKTYNFLQPLAIYKLRAPIIAVVLFYLFFLLETFILLLRILCLPLPPLLPHSLLLLYVCVCMYVYLYTHNYKYIHMHSIIPMFSE